MKPETRTLWVGLSSLIAFLFANLFPNLLPSIGNDLQSADPSIWIIICLVAVSVIQAVLLWKKHKER